MPDPLSRARRNVPESASVPWTAGPDRSQIRLKSPGRTSPAAAASRQKHLQRLDGKQQRLQPADQKVSRGCRSRRNFRCGRLDRYPGPAQQLESAKTRPHANPDAAPGSSWPQRRPRLPPPALRRAFQADQTPRQRRRTLRELGGRAGRGGLPAANFCHSLRARSACGRRPESRPRSADAEAGLLFIAGRPVRRSGPAGSPAGTA